MTAPQAATPLTDDEYDALGALLAAPGARLHDVSTLEGYLTAIATAATPPAEAQWLAQVWPAAPAGADTGDDARERALGLALRHFHYLCEWLAKDAASFEPIFHCGPDWGIAAWCQGFLLGMEMDPAGWAPLQATQPDWFAPMHALAASDGREPPMPDEETEKWMDAVAPAVIAIHAARPRRQGAGRPAQRATPKVGRNDPCPCGSGKKYKKCCGAADA
ncbi:UPF0149 family protein [Duganella sp. LX20W]|uniref:UPF0149 family protein n=1 Tax=Rugamonas brunnea TaxID=2758569 RepID=A0A7W2ENR2_9BURK|nr:UPF0149 family protein [Rugamonas brunnea]MBA5635874.1 UPF0149 family protein [Rugamonas brunnea]